MNIPQQDAEDLLAMEKHRAEDGRVDFPGPGAQIVVPLVSLDGREKFTLTMRRGRIKLTQGSYQTLAHSAIVLARLDIDGPPHTNPDGAEFPCPHLHLYREGWGDKWAHPLPAARFRDPTNLATTLNDFMLYCNITVPPVIQLGLL